MREEELEDAAVCELCGEDLDAEDPTNFPLPAGKVICPECARSHGGVFDPELERWRVPPKLPSSPRTERSPD